MARKSGHKAVPDGVANQKADVVHMDVAHIYEQHRVELKGFISGRVAFIEDAEDILQNVFYSLVKIDLIGAPIEQISAWLYSVARNQIIDRSRKKKEERMPRLKRDSREDDFTGDLTDIIVDMDDSPETEYLRSLVWDEIEHALAELPAEQRSVFELTELQGFSFKEISESTGIAVNTLISRKRYAVLHLRERLGELYRDFVGE